MYKNKIYYFIFLTIVSLSLSEISLRVLQHLQYIEKFSPKSVPALNVLKKTATSQYNANVIPVDNEKLAWKLDPADSNINESGYRGIPYPKEKPEHSCRIAILGDSYTYGFSVPYQDTFVSLLQKKLDVNNQQKKYELLNFGVIGYSTSQELEQYKQEVQSYHPDIIFLAYVLNDLVTPEDSLKFFRGLGEKRIFLKKLSKYSQLLSFFYIQWIDFYLNTAGIFYHKLSYQFNSNNWHETKDNIAEINALSSQNKQKMIAAIFPFFTSKRNTYPFITSHKIIGEVFNKNNIPYIDLLDGFDPSTLDTFQISPDDSHPNKLGHQKIADLFYPFLTAQIEKNCFQ